MFDLDCSICPTRCRVQLPEVLPAKPPGSRGLRVVVEGFAGAGNSSLAAMLTYLWATEAEGFTNKYKFLLHLDANAMSGRLQEEVFCVLFTNNLM